MACVSLPGQLVSLVGIPEGSRRARKMDISLL